MRPNLVVFTASVILVAVGRVNAGPVAEPVGSLCAVEGFLCLKIHLDVRNDSLETDTGRRHVRIKSYVVVSDDKNWTGRTYAVMPKWEDLWPDVRERDIVKHLNRTNLPLELDKLVVAPEDMNGKTLLAYSPLPAKIEVPGEKTVVWDPALLAWGAYAEDGVLVRWGAAVGGMDTCPEPQLRGRSCRTVFGHFRIIRKDGPQARSSKYPLGCRGDQCARVPWIMIFHDKGFGFHCSEYSVSSGAGGLPGHNASHGCIRLFCDDAEWLNKEFVDAPGKGRKGTQIVVKPYPRPR